MINVTKTYLPDREKYQSYVNMLYKSGWLTNRGVLVQDLEARLSSYLGVKNIICVANGSLALQLAYKALGLENEVITTPFSFAATTSTLSWERLKPVFADINKDDFNIDPDNIRDLVNEKTTGIVPVHVFGNPCDIRSIQSIAEEYDLKVVYDAAHAFGTQYKGESVLNYGDISTVSFHSTKLFHTIEGGAVITNNDDLADKIRLLINFGITGPVTIESVGTNAKMNEFEAAMGLCVLDEIDFIVEQRRTLWERYFDELYKVVSFQKWNALSVNNYSYAPVLFKSEAQLNRVEVKLKQSNIISRRYFYPSLDTLEYLDSKQVCGISRSISCRILCLPLYPGLTENEQKSIINIIKNAL